MTLGNDAAARVRLIVWCKDCRHSDRARSRRDGRPIWRGDARPRMARAACVLAVRQPGGRYGRDRDRAVITLTRPHLGQRGDH
jgi:hypothetical protein